MANYTQLLAALASLPQTARGPQLAPLPVTGAQDIPPPDSLAFPTPEPPPGAPSQPLDDSIIQRYLSLIGPAPTPPTPQAAPGTLERIALALQGFSAGMQGQAPQFLAHLRAERERPQREYEAQKREYEARRSQFGLRGIEAAQSAEDRRQARTQAEADRRFELEVQQRARQLGFRDQVAVEKLRDAMATQRQMEAERIADEKQKAAFDQQLKIEQGKLRKHFLDQGAGKHADELARYTLGQTDTLSPAAEKANLTIQAKIAALQRRAAGGGSSGGGGLNPRNILTLAELSDGTIVPYDKLKTDMLPPGVTLKRVFSPQLQAPAAKTAGPEGPVTATEIQEARKAGVPEAVIKAEIQRRGIAPEAPPPPQGERQGPTLETRDQRILPGVPGQRFFFNPKGM